MRPRSWAPPSSLDPRSATLAAPVMPIVGPVIFLLWLVLPIMFAVDG